MAFSENFIAYQVLGEPNAIYFKDLSTGSNANIFERRIFMQLYDGTYLVPDGTETDYIVWPLDQITFKVDCLKEDSAPNITVQWDDEGGFALINDTDLLLINSTDKLIF